MTVQAVHRSIGWAVAALLAGVCGLPTAVGNVHLQQQDSGVRVLIDGEHFTTYLLTGHAKPILFPIHAAGGNCVTRSWPMRADNAEDPHDHPHHESLWFAHGNVNGIDFWTHKAVTPGGPQPSITHESVRTCTSGATGVLETTNRWCAADGSVVCTDFRRLEFFGTQTARTIDFALTIRADHGAVTFGDTKEGTMGMRVHPALQLPDATRPQAATGRIVNSEGQRDVDVWGQPARWIDFSGVIDNQSLGIAILDHPGNLRHPTRWHARGYGLCAANPFGLHDFSSVPKGTGDWTIPAGGSLTLRYLFIVHSGDAATAAIENHWQRWIKVTWTGKPALIP